VTVWTGVFCFFRVAGCLEVSDFCKSMRDEQERDPYVVCLDLEPLFCSTGLRFR